MDAVKGRRLLAAVDGHGNHGAAAGLLVNVRVLRGRQDTDLRAVGVHRVGEAVRSLEELPAVVPAAAAGRLEVDLFPEILPDIANPHVTGLAVEAELPRVAQPVRPDLRQGVRVQAGEGILRLVPLEAEEVDRDVALGERVVERDPVRLATDQG